VITRLKVPKIDANIEEGTVTAWLKQEGDRLRKGEPLLEMTTDKAAGEVEAPCAGILRQILAREHSTVPVGYVLALIGGADDPLPDVSAYNESLLARRREAMGIKPKPAAVHSKSATAGAPAAGGPLRATPSARRLAREKGLDLALIQGKMNAAVVNEKVIEEYLKQK